MGNSPSKAHGSSPNTSNSSTRHYQQHHHPPSSSASASHAQPHQSSQTQNHVAQQSQAQSQSQSPSQPLHQRRESRARESSIHALSATGTVSAPKATAKPSASFESATAESTPSPSSARDSLRSQNFSQPAQVAQLRSIDPSASPARPRTASTTSEKMGQGGSRPAAANQSKTPSTAQPINIQPATSDSHPQSDTQLPPLEHSSAVPDGSYFLHASEYSRAPRLPLPIGEEFYAPGSPILSPEELAGPIEPIGGPDEPIPRRSSVLSTTTVDTDDYGDDLDTVQSGALPPVPTLIEWRGQGTRIYVTGTFAGWDRKYRLFRNGPTKEKDVFSAIINLQPGTYHLRFIVDGSLITSPNLPTAVDFTNSLVNYIEVVKSPSPGTSAQFPSPIAQPAATEPVDIKPRMPEVTHIVPPGIFPPLILPPTPELIPITDTSSVPAVSATGKSTASSSVRKPAPIVSEPPKRYHRVIPQFLIDFDAAEESPRFSHASIIASTAHPPPTLPMFLNKSILNGNTPMKDDASVLILPNHTVLNHLATSSIRNEVLATSATTRYKRKFLTSIMYKPTHPDS